MNFLLKDYVYIFIFKNGEAVFKASLIAQSPLETGFKLCSLPGTTGVCYVAGSSRGPAQVKPKGLENFREGLDTRTELFQGRRFDIEVEDGVADAGSFEFRFVNRIVKFFRIAETHHADDDGVGIVFLGHVDEHLSTRFVRVQCQGAAVEVLPLLGKLFQRIDTGRTSVRN